MARTPEVGAPPVPPTRLSIGVTGHRAGNAALAGNAAAVEAVLGGMLAAIDATARAVPGPRAATRLHTLLADGIDQISARQAKALDWDVVAPLPFGMVLNAAINALPETADDARALLGGRVASDQATAARAAALHTAYTSAHLLELADRDTAIEALFLAKLDAPEDHSKSHAFSAHASERAALAARVMIEQSDFLIGVWDGGTAAHVGGTGHSIAQALELGAPVIWIDPAAPADWRILRAPESLAAPGDPARDSRDAEVAALVRDALVPSDDGDGALFAAERWHRRSSRWWTAYRRVEVLFGGVRPFRSLTQVYETPDAIARGSGAAMLAAARALLGHDAGFAAAIESQVLRRFAWADEIAAYMSDAYRSGMIVNFLLAASAVFAGIIFSPLGLEKYKWVFAAVEFALLASILVITALGRRKRWHPRWFETRRVAEYLRHAPILLLLGVARAPGRWPRGAGTAWPEYHARHALRDIGLPRVRVTSHYLRAALTTLLDVHVTSQRDYQRCKAARLTKVRHRLDTLAANTFRVAVLAVSLYLVLKLGTVTKIMPYALLDAVGPWTAFLGVFMPVAGATLSGIRFFGDFERFAAISEVTAEKLDGVASRIAVLLSGPDTAIDYARVSELAHATDDIVIDEIENWQAVFGGKHITVPA